MEIISIDDKNAIQTASEIIKSGGLIVYPTDTLYGLGVDSRNESAINRVNQIKNRKTPISVIGWSIDIITNWVNISSHDLLMVNKILTESNTVILPVKDSIVHPLIMGDNQTLGIRMPKYRFPIELCNNLGFPITTTSVNKSGDPPLNDPKLIIDQFGNEIDLIIDAGALPTSSGSTIYKFDNSKFEIIRS
ncbi:MAG: L-threonylcarbamoyladenylate synthase [Candidatus Neomarinimicrobiota bacterium]|jgi:L-threonylcarbamoyladenylate synthase|nr:L-threonylcarbamoyladenylate synthase [Candidatus Neomarinimicrobiota bacterium]|tara:strand:+ start:1066 stop:1638 length:573 start_codon:yes stop_codon:yes gene_type:complete